MSKKLRKKLEHRETENCQTDQVQLTPSPENKLTTPKKAATPKKSPSTKTKKTS